MGTIVQRRPVELLGERLKVLRPRQPSSRWDSLQLTDTRSFCELVAVGLRWDDCPACAVPLFGKGQSRCRPVPTASQSSDSDNPPRSAAQAVRRPPRPKSRDHDDPFHTVGKGAGRCVAHRHTKRCWSRTRHELNVAGTLRDGHRTHSSTTSHSTPRTARRGSGGVRRPRRTYRHTERRADTGVRRPVDGLHPRLARGRSSRSNSTWWHPRVPDNTPEKTHAATTARQAKRRRTDTPPSGPNRTHRPRSASVSTEANPSAKRVRQ